MDTRLESFGMRNFGTLHLGDERRTACLVKAVDIMCRHPGGTLPDKLNRPADLRAFYRLMRRPEVIGLRRIRKYHGGPAEPDRLMHKKSKCPLVIGWKEFVDFPDWGLEHIKVKIDTGARTSALDVATCELMDVAGEGLMAELHLALHRNVPHEPSIVRTPVLNMVVVTNSSGMREQRPLIETRLRLGRVTKLVRLTVTNRSGMRFPIILGRKALEGDFLVDVSRKYLLRE